ncbi:flagellar basal-body rod protein FlgF [Pararobbsia silviterrae]|uniref:Flagellar basal-body rod protein FlgF n=1 Tax=Pararobbsia silviterrae TaxID=1792498 RepID=A0A494X6V1_9BURK|nr:flagellar basal-body rod protein FlgF [Pararobbsia silviterrae]RKP45361.1 flagellar basal-body rod protein FlgF [Pararobbsia silviterrae]
MDRLIYTAMTGASQTLDEQATVANNLANTSTSGFRAQLSAFRAVPLKTQDQLSANNNDVTRTYVLSSTPTPDYTPGIIQKTGNPTDLAIQGDGWFAVQTEAGQEAYTRNGTFHVDENGQLVDSQNRVVLGNGGPISVPPGGTISFGQDGTISELGGGDSPNQIAVMDKLKLVNPGNANMVRGDDGLFRTSSGQPADDDPTVQVVSGAVETSNVNPVEAMVSMISNARQFEMQMKMLSTADSNEQSANALLNFSS